MIGEDYATTSNVTARLKQEEIERVLAEAVRSTSKNRPCKTL